MQNVVDQNVVWQKSRGLNLKTIPQRGIQNPVKDLGWKFP